MWYWLNTDSQVMCLPLLPEEVGNLISSDVIIAHCPDEIYSEVSSFHVTDTVHLQITQWFSLSELGISKTQYRRAE